MPPPKEAIDKAIDTLRQLNLDSFNADPLTIHPFGVTTLSWRVTGPVGSPVKFKLAGLPVSAEGTRVMNPGDTITYSLTASMFTISTVLGQVTVTVDAHDCLAGSIPEAEIRENIREGVDDLYKEDEYGEGGQKYNVYGIDVTVKRRRDAAVEVSASGIAIGIALKVEIPHFWDATLDVDALVILTAEGGRPDHLYRRFNTDFDLPWQAWVIGGAAGGLAGVGIVAVMEELVSRHIRPQIKKEVSARIRVMMDENLQDVPVTHRLYSLTTAADRVVFTVCPVADFPVRRVYTGYPLGAVP